MSGRKQRGKNEAYLCVSQESSNCRYPMQDVQMGLTKKKKRKKRKKEKKEKKEKKKKKKRRKSPRIGGWHQ